MDAMPLTKVLIQFMGPYPAENVVCAAAFEPELLVPVGYGSFLTDSMRTRYNYYFHRRGLPTVVAEPVSLEKGSADEIERTLEQMLSKYEARRPVVDMSCADNITAYALGSVVRSRKMVQVSLIEKSIPDGAFVPVWNGDHVKRVAFPRISQAEFDFLRDGVLPEEREEEKNVLRRNDLTRPVLGIIRTLSTLYAEGPIYWRDVVQRLRYALGGVPEYKEEYLMDIAMLGINDRAFEDLKDAGVLREFGRQNGIARFVFEDEMSYRLLMHIDRIPALSMFVTAAYVRAYGRAAAYSDLVLHGFSSVTGIWGSWPLFMMVYDEQEDAEGVYRFHMKARARYDEPVRKVLVRFEQTPLSDEARQAAQLLGVEIVSVARLGEVLEPR